MFGIVFELSSFIISVLFPIYASFKALQVDDLDLLKPWLSYWIIFASFAAFESIFGIFLHIIPFYSLIKLYFQVWLVLPQTKGAVFLYNNYFGPFLIKYESDIEASIDELHEGLWTTLDDFKKYSVFFVKKNILGMKVQKPQDPPKSYYFNYAANYLFGKNVEADDNTSLFSAKSHQTDDAADDKLSKSYIDSLLEQFKDPVGEPSQVQHVSATFFRSLLSTIPKSGITLRGDFPSNETTQTAESKIPIPNFFESSKKTATTTELVENSDEDKDDAEMNENNDGFFQSFGWVKVSKEKVE